MKYVVTAKVIDVTERFRSVYVSGLGKEAVFEKISLGWYLFLDGSRESLFIGWSAPSIVTGDLVKLTIEKAVQNANP